MKIKDYKETKGHIHLWFMIHRKKVQINVRKKVHRKWVENI